MNYKQITHFIRPNLVLDTSTKTEAQKLADDLTLILNAYAKLPDSLAVLTSIDEICDWTGIGREIHKRSNFVLGSANHRMVQMHHAAREEAGIQTLEEHHGMKILVLFFLRFQVQESAGS